MRSHQINFFLGPDDQYLIDAALEKCGEYVVLRPRSTVPRASLPNTRLSRFGEEELRILITRKQDVEDIVYKTLEGTDLISAVQPCNPVIEFDRCFVGDDFIRRGRLYYTTQCLSASGIFEPKSDGFIQWSRQVFSKVKAKLSYMKSGIYLGTQASKLADQGWKLKSH